MFHSSSVEVKASTYLSILINVASYTLVTEWMRIDLAK